MSDPWRDTYRRLQSEGTPSCPGTERLCALVLGELAEKERLELADHVVSCKRCSETMRDLLELHGEAAPELSIAAPRPASAWRALGGWRLAGAAAVVGLALGLTFVARRSPAPPAAPHPAVRGSAGAVVGLEPEDRATLSLPPARLEWPAEEGVEGYSIVLYDFEATPLWESPLVSVPAIEIPEAVRAQIASGGTYYWRVTSLTGIERRQSDLHSFTLAP